MYPDEYYAEDIHFSIGRICSLGDGVHLGGWVRGLSYVEHVTSGKISPGRIIEKEERVY